MGSGWSSLVDCDQINFNDSRIIDEIKSFISNDESQLIGLVGKHFIDEENPFKRRNVRRVIDKD